jgi:hypothetical protein
MSAEGLSSEELDALRSILGAPVVSRALGKDPEVLAECLEIAEFGSTLEADDEVAEAALLEYLKQRNPATFQRALKRILQQTHDLPEKFVDLGSGVEDLLGLAADAQSLGGEGLAIFHDEQNLEALSKKGVGGAKHAVLAPLVSEMTGVPLDIAKQQPLKKSLKGVEFAQQLGYPGALTDPEFWKDLDQPGPATANKWQERAAQQENKDNARRERELDESLKKLKEAQIDRELERRRERRALARKQKAKKRKARRRKRPKAVLIMPTEIEMSWDRQVATNSGTNYVLRSYQDGTSELYRVEADGWHLVLPRAHHGYQVSEHGSGLPLVVPVLGSSKGRRRASPLDVPRDGQGPTGMKP